MKYWMSMALFAALSLGAATAQADDLTLPRGESIPLGARVAVWNGRDSYFAGKIDAWLADPALPKALADGFIEKGVYGKSERAEAEKLAGEVMQLIRDSRAYQLRSTVGNTMYTAYVFSLPIDLPLSEAETTRWQRWAETAARAGGLSEEELQKLSGHGEIAQSLEVGMKAAMAAGTAEAAKDTAPGEVTVSRFAASPLRAGVSKGGVSYKLNFVRVTTETFDYASPLWVGMLGTTKADGSDLTVTLLLADQASGRYFEPILTKAMEAAK